MAPRSKYHLPPQEPCQVVVGVEQSTPPQRRPISNLSNEDWIKSEESETSQLELMNLGIITPLMNRNSDPLRDQIGAKLRSL